MPWGRAIERKRKQFRGSRFLVVVPSVLTTRPVFSICYVTPSQGDKSTSEKGFRPCPWPRSILPASGAEKELGLQSHLTNPAAFIG